MDKKCNIYDIVNSFGFLFFMISVNLVFVLLLVVKDGINLYTIGVIMAWLLMTSFLIKERFLNPFEEVKDFEMLIAYIFIPLIAPILSWLLVLFLIKDIIDDIKNYNYKKKDTYVDLTHIIEEINQQRKK